MTNNLEIFIEDNNENLKILAEKYSQYKIDCKPIGYENATTRIINWFNNFNMLGFSDFELILEFLNKIEFLKTQDIQNKLLELSKKYLNENSFIAPLGEISESSFRISSEFHKFKNYSTSISELLDNIETNRNQNILLFDDFLNSGGQVITIFYSLLGKNIPKYEINDEGDYRNKLNLNQIQKLEQSEIHMFYYKAFDEGIKKAEEKLVNELNLNIKIHRYIPANLNDGAFGDSADQKNIENGINGEIITECAFQNKQYKRLTGFYNILKNVGEQLLRIEKPNWEESRYKSCALGYGNMCRLTITDSNTPTTTLTPLWLGGKIKFQNGEYNWKEFLPRRSKSLLGYTKPRHQESLQKKSKNNLNINDTNNHKSNYNIKKWIDESLSIFINSLLTDGFNYPNRIHGWGKSIENVAVFYYDLIPTPRVQELKNESSPTQSFWAIKALRKCFNETIVDLPIRWDKLLESINKSHEKHTHSRHIATSVLYLYEILESKKEKTAKIKEEIKIFIKHFEELREVEEKDPYNISYIISAIICAIRIGSIDISSKEKYIDNCENYLDQIQQIKFSNNESSDMRSNFAKACRLSTAAFMLSEVINGFTHSTQVIQCIEKLVVQSILMGESTVDKLLFKIPQFTVPLILTLRNLDNYSFSVKNNLNEKNLLQELFNSYNEKNWYWNYLSCQSLSLILLLFSREPVKWDSFNSKNYSITSQDAWHKCINNKTNFIDIFESRINWILDTSKIIDSKDAKLFLSVENEIAQLMSNNNILMELLLKNYVNISPDRFLPLGVYFPLVDKALEKISNIIILYKNKTISVYVDYEELESLQENDKKEFSLHKDSIIENAEKMLVLTEMKIKNIFSRITQQSKIEILASLRELHYYIGQLGSTSYRLENSGELEWINAPIRQKRRIIVDYISKNIEQIEKKFGEGYLHYKIFSEIKNLKSLNTKPRLLFKNGLSWDSIYQKKSIEFCQNILKNTFNAIDTEFHGKGMAVLSPRQGIIRGIARVVKKREDYVNFITNEIIIVGDFPTNVITQIISSGKIPAAIISQEGGRACHAAQLCLEMNWPCAVGVQGVHDKIKSGWMVEYRTTNNVAIISAKELIDENGH